MINSQNIFGSPDTTEIQQAFLKEVDDTIRRKKAVEAAAIRLWQERNSIEHGEVPHKPEWLYIDPSYRDDFRKQVKAIIDEYIAELEK